MKYYEVLVGDMQYHGNDALTYSSETELHTGAVVRVTLRAKPVLAIVIKAVPKPSFAAKAITASAPFQPFPATNLKLLAWLRAYYPAPLGSVVRQFLPPSTAFPKPTEIKPLASTPDPQPAAPLTTEQQHAIETITGSGSYLLHGITGSGKSRVYIELATRTLAAGRSAVILTPEIGLTAQLTDTFRSSFGANVVVLHSAMTAATRRDAWYQLLEATSPMVVIGPRSALFSPLKNIGLVVVDEAHDQAYKNESAPHYHASRVAAVLAQLHTAVFVSGSATPSVEDYYVATEKKRPIVAMQHLATQTSDGPKTIVPVDLRDQTNFSRSRILSKQLIAATTASLAAHEQTLLFLNRRGTANVVLCSSCGWQVACPHCDLPLTYHADEHRLRCHVCGYTTHLPGSCPQCGNADILLKSIGTKAVLDEVARLFPQAAVQRFDTDLHKDDRLEQHITALQSGSADIIVGTQMITKGLDLPRLSVVGIINADSSLLIPDYTAAERTFQIISQVTGRVGRGHRAGTVVVQSYEPGNVTLQAATTGQWQAFYDRELAERKQYHFPPFCFLLKLNCLRATSKAAETAANKLAATVEELHPSVTIEGPTPAFHPREKGKYNWQIIVKSSTRTALIDIIRNLPSGWAYDIDPINLL